MLSPDDMTHTTDALERLPRQLDRRTLLSERRQTILQQRHTDILPQVSLETPPVKAAWRQVVQLREENRSLRSQLAEERAELQRLSAELNAAQIDFENEVAIIHEGHRKEIEYYQGHLREMTDERNHLQDAHFELEQRYQNLYHSFQTSVEEEARRMVTEATQTIELTPDSAPDLLQDVVKKLESQIKQEENKRLIETLYLKHEVERMGELLKQEREQIATERQNLFAMQQTVRQQAELRYKVLQAHLRARWQAVFAFTSIGGLLLLVVLQFIFLVLLRVPLAGSVSLALLAPIVICSVLSIVLATPFTMVKHIYESAPHKKRVK
jgi:chromosome segregation ATPase